MVVRVHAAQPRVSNGPCDPRFEGGDDRVQQSPVYVGVAR